MLNRVLSSPHYPTFATLIVAASILIVGALEMPI